MNDFFLWMSLILGFLVLVSLYRGIGGPGFLNRIVAINDIGTKSVVILVLMGLVIQRVDMFVDISLAYALLNFIGTLAAAKYLERKGAI
ncbi:MAG: monovalent cation/H+ antiporter complex subunit F [Thermodesulfobacteriota bacterium]|nr:monovalent cation/H+ antiporter complex subunit F [Thermodesulfobacteriota bacterium]